MTQYRILIQSRIQYEAYYRHSSNLRFTIGMYREAWIRKK